MTRTRRYILFHHTQLCVPVRCLRRFRRAPPAGWSSLEAQRRASRRPRSVAAAPAPLPEPAGRGALRAQSGQLLQRAACRTASLRRSCAALGAPLAAAAGCARGGGPWLAPRACSAWRRCLLRAARRRRRQPCASPRPERCCRREIRTATRQRRYRSSQCRRVRCVGARCAALRRLQPPARWRRRRGGKRRGR